MIFLRKSSRSIKMHIATFFFIIQIQTWFYMFAMTIIQYTQNHYVVIKKQSDLFK